MTENEIVEKVAKTLEPKFRGFGGGDMPLMVAREVARVAVRSTGKEFAALARQMSFKQVDPTHGQAIAQAIEALLPAGQ